MSGRRQGEAEVSQGKAPPARQPFVGFQEGTAVSVLTDASHTPGGKREGTWEGAASALAEELSFAGQGNSRCGAGGGSGGQAAGPRGLWQGPTLRAQPASRPSAPPPGHCAAGCPAGLRGGKGLGPSNSCSAVHVSSQRFVGQRETIFPIPGSFLFFLSDKNRTSVRPSCLLIYSQV